MTSIISAAEELVHKVMGGWDASHDAFHAFRVRDLALAMAKEEQIPSQNFDIVELASLLHDIEDHKYDTRADAKVVENFLESHGIPSARRQAIMFIINNMGFKDELENSMSNLTPEFAVVQDADRLDALGAIGIARCFTFGGSRKRVLHNPAIQPCPNISKKEYTRDGREQTTINHFHEKLLKLKVIMKTKAGKIRAERRHAFMEEYLKEFYAEWTGVI